MDTAVKALHKLTSTAPLQRLPPKTRFDFSRFAAGDRVYINGKKPKFSKPLQQGGQLGLRYGFISHDEIIGARPSQIVKSDKGYPCRIEFPDLDTYISSMPRKVAPVYSTYADYIVSLFDIHVAPPTSGEDRREPLEILDAGTGHGSMTLHLARAIQAANPPVPDADLAPSILPGESPTDGLPDSGSSTNEYSAQVLQDWRRSRRAIVHSVEISSTYSKHAETKVVAGFRRGLYSPHIDFHVANVNDWIHDQLEVRIHEPFLSYIVLDMPSSHKYLHRVVTAMKDSALIAVFVPSITQIGDCVREIKANALPLNMEKALELGDGISNGRLWDVRLALKRAKDPVDESSTPGPREGDEDESVREETETESETSSGADPKEGVPSEEPVMVCRPMVGERVIGGGFVGLWRRVASH